MPSFILSEAAEKDLLEIGRYTCKTWGAKQAGRYLNALEIGCEKIASGEAICKSFLHIHLHLKSTHCEHHYLFFLHTKGEKPIIIAVLHERMDMLAKLRERLL